MTARALPGLLPLAATLVFLAGCGGDDSASELASLAPPASVVYVEGQLRPSGQLKSNVDSAAATIAGKDNLGDFIVSELESSAEDDGEPFDYAEEVEPWLGEKAAVIFQRLEDGDLSDPIVVVESTDTDATQRFIDRQVEESKDPYREASHDGVDYVFGGSDENAIAVVGDFLVVSEGEQPFKAAVDAANGEALAGEDRFQQAFAEATEGSLADAYVDVGGLIEQSDDEIDPGARQALQSAGIDPSAAIAMASLVPGRDRIEIDLSSDLAGEEPPSGDASDLLGSLPADSFAALAVSGFGEQLKEAIDSLDEEGIPGSVPPGELKSGLGEAGIDLDSITGSLRDAAAFAVGDSEGSLGGALVLTTEGSRAANTISNLGLLLGRSGVSGLSPLRGQASGFSVRSPELGSKPLVVAADKGRIAIGYGLPTTLRALEAGSGPTLAANPVYDDAVAALGDTPIGAFADGPAAMRLADALVPASDQGFREAQPYLESVRFLAMGSGSEGDLATAKLIVGLEK